MERAVVIRDAAPDSIPGVHGYSRRGVEAMEEECAAHVNSHCVTEIDKQPMSTSVKIGTYTGRPDTPSTRP